MNLYKSKEKLIKSLLLYGVTDQLWSKKNNISLYDQVEESLKGGITFVQLREKTLDKESFYKLSVDIKKLCEKYRTPFVINDNIYVAKKCDADGIHIGQDDMPLLEAREILGENKIIGMSVFNKQQAIKAEKESADYLGVGAMFSTNTKSDAKDISIKVLKEICESVEIPVVAIGGITLENMKKLKGSKIDGVAIVSAIYGSDDIKKSSEELLLEAKRIIK